MRRLYTLLFALPLLAAAPAVLVEHTIANDLKGGYQVVAADLNHDGRPDLIALASGLTELVWYENPGWQRHVLASGQSRMINCVVVGNEIVLASAFANQAKDSVGIVSVLRPGDDPREPWTVTEIDRLTTSHRLRTADIDGSGHLVVINAPLTGAAAAAPDYRDQTPLVYYVPGEWKRRVISTENSGVVHGIFVTDWDGDGRQDILTASFTGIHLFRYTKDSRWTRTEIAKGDPAPGRNPAPATSPSDTSQRRDSWPPSNPGTATRSRSTPNAARSGSAKSSIPPWLTATPSRPPTSTATAWTKSSPASAANRAASIFTATTPPPRPGRAAIWTKAVWAPPHAP